MTKYYVRIQVNYDGYLEANNEKEATDLAWSSYYGMDAPLQYESVESIEVEELKSCDTCGECIEEPHDECTCEETEEQEE